MVWSITLNAPLEEPANPNLTMNPAKAPWYFLGLQEMLVYFDPWIAGVVMPTMIIIGLMVILTSIRIHWAAGITRGSSASFHRDIFVRLHHSCGSDDHHRNIYSRAWLGNGFGRGRRGITTA